MQPSFQRDTPRLKVETELEVTEKKLEMAAPQCSSLRHQSDPDP